MSTIESKIVSVEILPHPNANKLSIARIGGEGGFECAVGLDQFQTGDLAIYIMSDSVLTEEMCATLTAKSKIEIKGGRIRAINIRGTLSEGLCLDPKDWLDHDVQEGDDVTKELGVIKYEPPPSKQRGGIFLSKRVNWNYQNPNFIKYSCVEKFKKYPKVLVLGEEVIATKKMHGSNWRGGLVKKTTNDINIWQKIKDFIFGRDDMEFLVGSHNKIRFLNKGAIRSGEWKKDTYWTIAKKYNIESIVRQIAEHEMISSRTMKDMPQVIIYGEVIGGKIQKNYSYNISNDDLEIRVFDIMINRKFLDWDRTKYLCKCFNLPMVDEVYRGPWNLDVAELAEAIDEYDGQKFIREGIVIKPREERSDHRCGRVCFKYLNPQYLLNKQNTDFH